DALVREAHAEPAEARRLGIRAALLQRRELRLEARARARLLRLRSAGGRWEEPGDEQGGDESGPHQRNVPPRRRVPSTKKALDDPLDEAVHECPTTRLAARPPTAYGSPAMTTADLRELCDLNYAEALRELTRRAGGVVHDEGGLLLYAGTHPLPV